MAPSIHILRLGFDSAYLIEEEGAILIDGGAPRTAKKFQTELNKLGKKPREIKLIVLTYGHWDHVGSAAEIKEMTGAQILLHQSEQHWLERSLKPMPPGRTTWGNISTRLFSWTIVPLVTIPPAKVDIVIGNDDFDLASYGISGKVVFTPGHSMGSVSVVLTSGEAFVGDMAMNKFPLRLSPGLSIYAENSQMLFDSWKTLINEGVRTVYPAHGEPFSIDIIKRETSTLRRMT